MSMPRVVGIDYSSTKTGLGVVTRRADGSCLATGSLLRHPWPTGKTQRAKAGLPEALDVRERRKRFTSGAREIVRAAGTPALVVIAQPYTSAPGQGSARVDLIAGWWAVVAAFVRQEVPVAFLHDSTAKKAITGSGRNEDKAAVSVGMVKLYPDVEIESDDVGDALAFAHLGAVALGWDVPTLARHREVKWTEWPASEPLAAEGVA